MMKKTSERQEAGAQQPQLLAERHVAALRPGQRRPELGLDAAADDRCRATKIAAISRPGRMPASQSWRTGWRAIIA